MPILTNTKNSLVTEKVYLNLYDICRRQSLSWCVDRDKYTHTNTHTSTHTLILYGIYPRSKRVINNKYIKWSIDAFRSLVPVWRNGRECTRPGYNRIYRTATAMWDRTDALIRRNHLILVDFFCWRIMHCEAFAKSAKSATDLKRARTV